MIRGDRVRLSKEAKRAGIRRTKGNECRGTFIGLERGFYIKVLWDGNISAGSGYHPDFIEADTVSVLNGEEFIDRRPVTQEEIERTKELAQKHGWPVTNGDGG